jgi:hypothetical protein
MASQDPEGAPDEMAEPVDPGTVGASDVDAREALAAVDSDDEGDAGEPVDRPEASGG